MSPSPSPENVSLPGKSLSFPHGVSPQFSPTFDSLLNGRGRPPAGREVARGRRPTAADVRRVAAVHVVHVVLKGRSSPGKEKFKSKIVIFYFPSCQSMSLGRGELKI